MKYGFLGTSGLEVSRVALGCMTFGSKSWYDWVLDEKQSRPMFKKALDAGINVFDTSDIYSDGLSETLVGKYILRNVPRDKVIVATITHNHSGRWPNYIGISRKQIFDAIDATLRRMKTDYVDLYQIPRYDWRTPDEETMEALHDVVKAGKARYIGASSMLAYQFSRLNHVADMNGWTRFASMSNHYNLVYREEEREMVPYCVEEGIGMIPWSPLGRGMLSGTRKRRGRAPTTRAKSDEKMRELYVSDVNFRVIDRVVELAGRRGLAPAQVAIAWLLHQPGVTAPIVGATKPRHITDAAKATEIVLDDDELGFLEEPYEPHPVMGFDPTGETNNPL